VKNWWILALGIAFGLLGAGSIWLASSPPRGYPIQLLPPPTPIPITIHVSGAVQNPGLYTLPIESRVADAIEIAGGLTAEANDLTLNLAAQLKDGMQIWVPAQLAQPDLAPKNPDSEPNISEKSAPTNDTNPIVNINAATQEELETLTGIGPVTAQKIIAFRTTEGLFLAIEEIQKVSGIGPATFEKIKDQITVGRLP
jgi:competence protein ComEA